MMFGSRAFIFLVIYHYGISQILVTDVSREYTDLIFFQLYTGPSVKDYISIPFQEGLTLCEYPFFNRTGKTIFYFPGFGENPNKSQESVDDLAAAFLSLRPKINLVVLDYSQLVQKTNYQSAVKNGSYIGRAMGEYFRQYIPVCQLREMLHHIGHSLGAQIISAASEVYKSGGRERFVQITGLDPAGPLFIGTNIHLNANDADCVDIIHTSCGTAGYSDPCGTIDFFPNGGRIQPNCRNIDATVEILCDHSCSWKFYAESVNDAKVFLAKACTDNCRQLFPKCLCNQSDLAYMGYWTNTTKTGEFFLETNWAKPYGEGKNGLNFGINLNK